MYSNNVEVQNDDQASVNISVCFLHNFNKQLMNAGRPP